eukprot:TRINITY_DN285_c0_g1_i1.p1 TRINITY_DN285_c0_g1~~TRINITY_DN285_c0_g1_i1.p1  ORF type:complete len:438 (-),score=117.94 TRINITY_DN285_c0_g1_i1:154-1467(-)
MSLARKEGEFKEIVDAAVENARALADKGDLVEAINNLLAVEKETRLANDSFETSRLAVTILQLCFAAKNWKALIENIYIISKRRGQLKLVLTRVVQEAFKYVDAAPSLPEKLELIDCLRAVSEGKIHVENERARLTRMIAAMKEAEGKISEAAETLQEVQVETYGAMEKAEKTEFILEQVRLCLDAKDYVRAMIIIKKINTKVFADESIQHLKIRYYQLYIRYHTQSRNYVEIARCYLHIFDTPSIKADANQAVQALKSAVIFISLSAYSHEQSDFLNRTQKEKLLDDMPIYRELLKAFITQELLRWPAFQAKFGPELQASFESFKDAKSQHWTDLHRRVIEHNIRVISTYYSRISCKRLNDLLGLSSMESEKYLSELVVEKTIYARIDRPAGVISFQKAKDPAELLNEWSSNVAELLHSIEKTCHVIHKENMMYKI